MIILDASVLIAHFDAGDEHHEQAVQLLAQAEDPELGASVITLAEVMVSPARKGRLEEAQGAVDRLGIRAIAPDLESPQRLADLRASTRMKMPDCCVLDAARQNDGSVATLDRSLARTVIQMGLEYLPERENP